MRKDKPSKTARKVALNIVTLGAKPGMDRVLPPGVAEATAKLLVASGAVGAAAVRWSCSRRAVAVYEAVDWMMPGQFDAFAHRKAFCEHQVRDGIGAGATQVLVLGAGYDTLGWRLAPEFPGVGFFEIDHPATARLKARGIAELGQRDNLHLIQENLGERSLVEVLTASHLWDRTVPSVVVAEGLLMYLLPAAARDLFGQCSEIAGAGSRIAFTYIGTGVDGRPDAGRWTGLVLWILKASGEPWFWSIRPKELARFLEETGWTSASDLMGTSSRRGVEYFGVASKRPERTAKRSKRIIDGQKNAAHSNEPSP
ncbi:MAG: SAM-dependent methyltransferase [Thermoanaerobaculales bacterium]|nr:SAM-dependent methyltransferase [Thermoanaerobaculales bacterium]